MDINKLSINELLQELILCETENRYEDLLTYVNFLLLKDPNNSDILLYKIKAFEGLGTLNDNIDTIQNYINVKSTDATGFLLLHQAYLAQNYLAGAIIAIVYALSIEPDNEECFHVLLKLIQKVDQQYTQVKLNIMTTDRIGHLACEIEPLLRNTQNEKNCLYIFLSSGLNISNKYLYSLIKSHSNVIEDMFLFNLYVTRPRLLDDYFFAELPYDVNSTSRGVSPMEVSSKGYINLVDIYHNFPPVLKIPDADNALAWQLLSKFGISAEDKLVCLHVRDSYYLEQKYPQHDFSYHDYRDADIESYAISVQYLIEQGYKVIRIGSDTNQFLSIDSPNYFDFCANRNVKHGDFLEVFLLKVCDFFIGTNSGPLSIASIFDTPILSVNTAPFHPIYSKGTRMLPKYLYHQGDKVNFLDICNGKTLSATNNTKLFLTMSGKELKEFGYEYISNDEIDILEAVKEFNSQMKDKVFVPETFQTQIDYTHKFTDDFLFKKADCFVVDSFLKKHPDLF